ncbi:acyl-CoA dehydrogenase (plasmid) [Natrialba magadii ATCC 43099]|uniref:Acyl-CoA dehydrogenase n=1 Tax=Natrialba magadii (strain ATCC 43099 / DSM 3394 / CCM 3739 / CIP 104546 / IAM 13178 / JCM 8861 / NBRC 102185 / NCIMB 2190 / MS3) TaxID=547559 RepID=D3T1G1_NATMM|nr:acyl-CoA dehydrogenase family protein [Natrialba magadii]ADD07420.1 acyl-CoA dehydrogenase [Natrialba magadii ATCC 43099]
MNTPKAGAGVSFEQTEEQELILESLVEFVEQEVELVVEKLGETLSNPRLGHDPDGRLSDEVLEAEAQIRKASAEAGFYAMNMPAEVGGDDVSAVTWYLAKKQLAELGVPLTSAVLAGPGGPKPLLAQATGEQVERYLEPTMAGEKTTAFAQTEPGVGSDSPNMATRAERDGDEWVLNGTKQWITNAPYADFVQVFARTSPQDEVGRYGGVTCFIVEADEYEIGSLNNAVGAVGRQAEVELDDVRIPADRVLGEEGAAFYDAMDFLGLGRIEIAAESVGRTNWLLDAATEFANDREAFGRTIGNFQGISHKIARGRANAFAADAAGLRCAWLLDQGEAAIAESSICKWLATNTFWEVADDVVQIHGSDGLAEENPFMDNIHRARIMRIVEGTDEIQLNTIAKQYGVE